MIIPGEAGAGNDIRKVTKWLGDMSEMREELEGQAKTLEAKLYRYCVVRLNGDQDAAAECVQETFLLLMQKLDTIKSEDRLAGWLYKTAGFVMLKHREKNRREQSRGFSYDSHLEDGGVEFGEEDAGYERVLEDRSVELAFASRVLDRLREKEKLLFQLALVDELRYKKIGDMLGISEGAVKVRVSRLKERVKKLREEEMKKGNAEKILKKCQKSVTF